MLNFFSPDDHVKSIFDIQPETLNEQSFRGIITDLDNTLVPWDAADATTEIIEWFERMDAHHINITIISNNNLERVKKFSEPLNAPFLFNARKPLPHSFKQAAKNMELSQDDIVVIGDQLLTDILGGNLAGFSTILVTPAAQTDGKVTQFNRKIERRILNRLRKKGKISLEE